MNLTPEQERTHDKFLQHLKETNALYAGQDDRWTLLRFLKARQWDIQRAAVMYNTMTKWRREHGTDQLPASFHFQEEDAVVAHYPHFFHKVDKYGRPVYIELLGRSDPAKILENTTLDRLMDYHVCEWEMLKKQILPACSVLAGRPIITKDVILDMKGLGMKTFGTAAQKILHAVSVIDQDYYCESLGQMFIINTPTIFRLVWAVVNPLLEERTRRKIVILGSDYLPTITQLIPLENLPECLGGTSKAPDFKTNIGPWTEVDLAQHGDRLATIAHMERLPTADSGTPLPLPPPPKAPASASPGAKAAAADTHQLPPASGTSAVADAGPVVVPPAACAPPVGAA